MPAPPGSPPPRRDPHWALCPFDLRGACRDPLCPWQSLSDGVDVPGSAPPRPRASLPPCEEVCVPLYGRATAAPGWSSASLAFHSPPLAPASAATHAAMAPPAPPPSHVPADARAGRYFSSGDAAPPSADAPPLDAPAAAASSPPGAAAAAVAPGDGAPLPVDAAGWLALASRSAPAAWATPPGPLSPACLDGALVALARALEAHPSSPGVWRSYVALFSQRFAPSDARDMLSHALRHVPDCAPLWAASVGLGDSPQARASSAAAAASALRTLDSALLALHTFCADGDGDRLAAWARACVDDESAVENGGGAAAVAPTPAAPLLPRHLCDIDAAILLTCAAEAVMHGRLPVGVVARFGWLQRPVVPSVTPPRGHPPDLAVPLLRAAVRRAAASSLASARPEGEACDDDGAEQQAVPAENLLVVLACSSVPTAAQLLPQLVAPLAPRVAASARLRRVSLWLGAPAGSLRSPPQPEAMWDLLLSSASARGAAAAAGGAKAWLAAPPDALFPRPPTPRWAAMCAALVGVAEGDTRRALEACHAALRCSGGGAGRCAAEVAGLTSRVDPRSLPRLAARVCADAAAAEASAARSSTPGGMGEDALPWAARTPHPLPTGELASFAAACIAPPFVQFDVVVDTAEAALAACPSALPFAIEAARRSEMAGNSAPHAVTWAVPLLVRAMSACPPAVVHSLGAQELLARLAASLGSPAALTELAAKRH